MKDYYFIYIFVLFFLNNSNQKNDLIRNSQLFHFILIYLLLSPNYQNMKRLHITIVTKETGQLVDQILQSILDDIFKTNSPMQIQKQSQFGDLKNELQYQYHSNYDIHHASCYHQYVGNFCGYHATFANICCLQILQNTSSKYNIKSAASFWSFKNSIESFLFEYKRKYKMKQAWPWRDSDILYGDFQRTYNNICKSNSKMFLDYQNHKNIQMMECTWQFQFKNLIFNQQSRKEMNQKIKYFREFKKKNKLLIFTIMLAITNHWTCLIALKYNQKTQFWFFDSKNLDYLNYTREQILQHVQKLAEQKKKQNKPFDEWRKWVVESAMIDTQISLKLIVSCLKGEQSLQKYHYNRQFTIFAEHFEKIIQSKNHQIYLNSLIEWSTSYKHDLRRFFVNEIRKQDLKHENKILLEKMTIQITKHHKHHRDLKILSDYIQYKS